MQSKTRKIFKFKRANSRNSLETSNRMENNNRRKVRYPRTLIIHIAIVKAMARMDQVFKLIRLMVLVETQVSKIFKQLLKKILLRVTRVKVINKVRNIKEIGFTSKLI